MRRFAWFGRFGGFGGFGWRGGSCPAAWKLTRFAASGVPDPEVEQHLASCSKCAAQLEALNGIAVDARRLAEPAAMSKESRAKISARLLNAPAQRRTLVGTPARRSP